MTRGSLFFITDILKQAFPCFTSPLLPSLWGPESSLPLPPSPRQCGLPPTLCSGPTNISRLLSKQSICVHRSLCLTRHPPFLPSSWKSSLSSCPHFPRSTHCWNDVRLPASHLPDLSPQRSLSAAHTLASTPVTSPAAAGGTIAAFTCSLWKPLLPWPLTSRCLWVCLLLYPLFQLFFWPPPP